MKEPFLYSIINSGKLAEVLVSLEACINIPLQVIDETGNVICKKGRSFHYCSYITKFLPSGDTCKKQHLKAGRYSAELGESYIFSCHSNLSHIIYPILIKGSFMGAVLAGPFLMGIPDSTMLSDLAKKYGIQSDPLLELYDSITEIPVVEPSKVTQISRLITFLFDGLITDSHIDIMARKQHVSQQAKISESIHQYKNDGVKPENEYPFEMEKELLSKVKAGDIEAAKEILNQLLGYVFFSRGRNLENINARAVELTSLLSRAAIEGGAPTDAILKINNEFLKNISSIKNIDELCMKLSEIVEVFSDSMFTAANKSNRDIMKKAVSYISANYYNHDLTLRDVADTVHLNPTYFSALFKASCGSSFKEYLNMVRIEASKQLLSNTDYSIIDIAIATGFEDQSYFSKVFKRYTGFTPKKYR